MDDRDISSKICTISGQLGSLKMDLIMETDFKKDENAEGPAAYSLIKAFHHINLAIEELNMCRYFIRENNKE